MQSIIDVVCRRTQAWDYPPVFALVRVRVIEGLEGSVGSDARGNAWAGSEWTAKTTKSSQRSICQTGEKKVEVQRKLRGNKIRFKGGSK